MSGLWFSFFNHESHEFSRNRRLATPNLHFNVVNRESASRIPWLQRGSVRLSLCVRQARSCVSKATFAWFARFAVDNKHRIWIFQPRILRIWRNRKLAMPNLHFNVVNRESASRIPWLQRGSVRLSFCVRQARACVSKATFAWFAKLTVDNKHWAKHLPFLKTIDYVEMNIHRHEVR